MRRKKTKTIALIIYSSFIISILSMVAFASPAEGAWGYYNEYGYYYKNQSIIETSGSTNVMGNTRVGPETQTIPTGYVKAQCRIYYSSNGALYDQTLMIESNGALTPGNYWRVTLQKTNAPSKTTFYTKGCTQAYTPSGYVQYSTFASPDQSTT